MKTTRKRKTRNGLPNRVTAVLFIPFLVFHCACIIPVMEWSCLCPDDDPHWRCCCNCPKCVKRRGGFKSYCHLRHHESSEAEARMEAGTADHAGKAAPVSELKVPEVSLETLCCNSNSHIKNISLNFKPFLPATKIVGPVPVAVAIIILNNDRRPPEAIPCHPEVPG